jgi:hypothetical protein
MLWLWLIGLLVSGWLLSRTPSLRSQNMAMMWGLLRFAWLIVLVLVVFRYHLWLLGKIALVIFVVLPVLLVFLFARHKGA